MKKRNWKLGGLLVLLIALVLTLSVCMGAMAEDEEQPASFDVNVPWRVPQGDDLELSISTFQGATQYEIAIFDPVTWKRTYSEIVTSAEADAKAEDGWFVTTIPAENLQETGMYNLRIYAQEVTESFVNYLDGCGRYPVVYAAGDLPENDEPVLSVQGGDHPLNSSLYAVMTAPGASSVLVEINGDSWVMDGDWGMYPGYVDHAGTYTITGTAVYSDGTQVTKTETIEVKGEAKSLGKMNITLPEINAGEEATISFSKVSNADAKNINYYVEVLDQSDLQRYVFAKQFQSELDTKDPAVIAGIPDVELMGDSQTLTVNGENFEAGHGYLIRVVAASAGYEDLVYQNQYYIPPTEGSYKIWPSFYFPGEEGTYSKTVEASQEFPVCLQLQEMEEGALDTVRVVRICNGWNEYEDFANWGDAIEQMKRGEEFGLTRSFDSGEYAMYIQVGYGGPEEDWTEENLTWVTSNLLYVTVEAEDRVSVPSFDVNATMVTRGDTLVISNIQMDSRATNADTWLDSTDGWNHYYDFQINSDGEIKIPTIGMMPGIYQLTMNTYGPGLNSSAAHAMIMIQDNEELADGAVYISATETEVQTHEQVRISAYAPGANLMKLYAFDEEGNEIGYWENWWETIDQRVGGWDAAQMITIRAFASYYDEENDAWNWDADSAELEIAITVDGTLEDPTVTLAGSAANGTIATGESVSGTIIVPEGTEWAYVELVAMGDGWEDAWEGFDIDFSDKTSEEIHFNAGYFEDHIGTIFEIRAHANAVGKNSGHVTSNRFVVVGQQDAEKIVTLTVDGEVQDEVELLSSQSVTVHVDAPNATVVRVLNDRGWEFWWGEDDCTRDWGYGDGEYQLIAMASYDETPDFDSFTDEDWQNFDWDRDLSWTGISNVTYLHVSSPYGELREPTYHFENEEKNEEGYTALIQGEYLDIRIDDPAPVPKDENTDGPTDYWYNVNMEIRREDEEGNPWWDWVDLGNSSWSGTPDKMLIPTFNLEAGTYRVYIGVDAPGWNGDSAMAMMAIDENENLKPDFRVSNTEIVTSQDTTIIAYHPDAEWIDVDITREGDDGWFENRNDGGQMLYQNWGTGMTGTYIMTAIANQHVLDKDGNIQYDEDGNELVNRIEFGSLKVNVTAQGDLAEADLSGVPEILQVNSGIDTSFPVIENTEGYQIRLVYCAEDRDWEEIIDEWRDGNQDTSLKIEGSYFNETGTYKLSVYAGAYNWNASYVEKDILVVSGLDDQLILTVNGSAEDSELQASERFVVRAKAEGATAIRIYDGYNWQYDLTYGSGEIAFEWIFNSGSYSLVAEACYDTNVPSDGDEVDWDNWVWEDLEWSGISNIVKLTVTAASEVIPGEAFLTPTSVRRGEPLTVTVNGWEHAAEFNFNVRIQDENGNGQNSNMSTVTIHEEGTVQIPTASLIPGVYHLEVWVPGIPGYDAVDIEIGVFTVTEEAEDGKMIFTLSLTEGAMHENVMAMAYYPGAVHYEIFVEDENGEREEPEDGRGTGPDEAAEFGIEIRSEWKSVWAVAYDENHEVLATSEKIAIKSKETDETVTLQINLPAVLNPAAENRFTVNLDQATWNWRVELHRQDEDGWTELQHWYSWEGADSESFIIPAGVLESGNIYHVVAHGEAYGKNDGEDIADAVSYSSATVFHLNLPEKLTTIEEEAFEGIPMDVVVLTKDAEFDIGFLWDYGTRLLVIPDDANMSRYLENYGFAIVTQSVFDAN